MSHTRPAALAATALLGLSVSACTLHGDPQVALASPDVAAVAAPVRLGPGRQDVKTVRRTAQAGDDDAAGPTLSATPSPRQIFDFHPAGAQPDAWRQPFIIDPNDGPLAAEVRRSSAELHSYLAALKKGTAPAVARRCGENDVTTARPGCAAPATTGSLPKPPATGAAPPAP